MPTNDWFATNRFLINLLKKKSNFQLNYNDYNSEI